jgi:hypothetical protein
MPHERLKVAEVLVDAEKLHDEEAQPAADKAASAVVHSAEVNCEREVPDASVKSNGSVVAGGAGTVEQIPSVQQVTALA